MSSSGGTGGGLAIPLTIPWGATLGPPTTGAHLVGESYRDAQGIDWMCLVAGTPGTWRWWSPYRGPAAPVITDSLASEGLPWYDTVNDVQMGWAAQVNGGAWIPFSGSDPVLQEAVTYALVNVPVTALAATPSSWVPANMTVTPLCTGVDPIRVVAIAPLNIGDVGTTVVNRAVNLHVVDTTLGAPGAGGVELPCRLQALAQNATAQLKQAIKVSDQHTYTPPIGIAKISAYLSVVNAATTAAKLDCNAAAATSAKATLRIERV